MRFCPKCSTEYRDEFEKCADCHIDLVNDPFGERGELSFPGLVKFFENQFPEPFYPEFGFYDTWDDSNEQLNVRSRTILKWLRCSQDNVVAQYNNLYEYGSAKGGFYVSAGDKHIILVNEKFRWNPLLVNAVLAHECIHHFLTKHGLHHLDPKMNEQKTDLCVIATGLGILMINGMQHTLGAISYAEKWHVALFKSLASNGAHDLSLGAFSPNQFCEFFEQYLTIKQISGSQIIGYIQPLAHHYLSRNIRKAKPDKEIRIVTLLKKLHRRNFIIHCLVVVVCAIPTIFLLLARLSPEIARDIWKVIFG